ncbi:unnamed protein product [Anisakis simplex]|uniref:Uncharacterized protein n=1 Tax=Anisakis simplex TaxID=6269 RepID=A0A0M3JT18_ANISI|nr:unnamed protein product [Anisakis simplex]
MQLTIQNAIANTSTTNKRPLKATTSKMTPTTMTTSSTIITATIAATDEGEGNTEQRRVRCAVTWRERSIGSGALRSALAVVVVVAPYGSNTST